MDTAFAEMSDLDFEYAVDLYARRLHERGLTLDMATAKAQATKRLEEIRDKERKELARLRAIERAQPTTERVPPGRGTRKNVSIV
jgi:hypothetical protein